MKVKQKITLLVLLEVAVAAACLVLSGTGIQWMVNIYGSSDTANLLSAATVLAAGLIVVSVLVFIACRILKIAGSDVKTEEPLPQAEDDESTVAEETR